MTSQDDLALLKRMYQRGEITDEQYDVLRRHVLWGTPLPQLGDDVPAPRPAADPTPRAAGPVPSGAGPAPRGGARSAPVPGGSGPVPGRPVGRDAGTGPGGYVPGTGTVGPGRYPEPGDGRYPSGPPEPAPPDPGRRYAGEPGGGRYPVAASGPVPVADPPGGRRYASRRERREAEEAGAAPYPPSTHLPPAGGDPPPTAPRRSRHRRDDPDEAPDQAHVPEAHRSPPGAQDIPVAYGPPATAYPSHPAPAPDEPIPRRSRRADPESDDLATRRFGRLVEAEPELDETEPGGDLDGGRAGRTTTGRRRPRRRSVVAVLASVVLALLLAAAGVYWFVLRTDGMPPATYARETCGSVRDWQQAVDSSNATLVNSISRQADPSTVRADVVAYYATVATRTDELRTAILDRGPADVPGGREYADSLAAAVGDQATALRALADRARRLDPAAATFQSDVQAVLTGADTAVSAVSAALARPAAGITTELRTTLSNEPACAPYVG